MNEDEFGLAGAAWAALRSDCRRRQVGAVIIEIVTDGPWKVVSAGHNHIPVQVGPSCGNGGCARGKMSFQDLPPGAAYVSVPNPCPAIHAEESAILQANRDLSRCVLYVNFEPCENCWRFIRGTGLSWVVWRTPDGETRQEKLG